MSVTFLNNSGGNNTNIPAKTLLNRRINLPATEPWVRNPSWPTLTAPSDTDQKVVGLHAVWPGDSVGTGGNFFAATFAGNCTIDYGDGITANSTANVTIYKEFDYNNVSLANTNAPVTITASTDTINRTAHGYTNDMPVQFFNIVSTTGIVEGQTYYVTNTTANTFQISEKIFNRFSVAAQDSTPTGIFFKDDGTKMYIIGSANDRVNEYDLSTAWNISTASYLQNFSVAAQDSTPTGIFFKSDGTKMYIIGSANDRVNEYDLSTAWNISTASYLQNFSVAAQDSTPTGIFFKDDGTKMYIIGETNDRVNEYNLSTAWNISTASYLQNFSVAAQETTPTGIFFKSDGTKMYIIGSTNDRVNEYNLSTAWNISTASYLQNLKVSDTTPQDIFFKSDGTMMFIIGSAAVAVLGYSLSTPWDINTAEPTVNEDIVQLTNDGSATLLPYKIATVTITPNIGQNLTRVTLYVKHNQTGLGSYATGWLDLAIAGPNITSLTIGSSATTIYHSYLERVNIVKLGNITDFTSLFNNLGTLKDVQINVPNSVTNMSSMFSGCSALTSVPLFNTASVTNMSSMFTVCRSLTTVPLFNTALVTNMNSMFSSCSTLTTVPLFNTALVTDMGSMFSSCNSLTTVPLFNTALVTDMGSMFSSCTALTSVPLFNTASVTAMNSMFSGCNSLTSVPLFNTASVTNMSSMFSQCFDLTSVPLFNTASVTNMSSMFSGCRFLTSVPLFNTALVTTMNSMFSGCTALTSVPLFNTALVTDMLSMFSSCTALTTVPLFNTALVTTMSGMFSSCSALTSVPLFNTALVTNMSSMFSGCRSLTSVPEFVTTTVTSSANFSNMFLSCNSLARIRANRFRFTFSITGCKLSKTAIEEIYTNLPNVNTSQTITVTTNYGVDTAVIKTANTIAQSNIVLITNTVDLRVGDFVTGLGSGITTNVSVSSNVTTDSLTLVNHGLSNNTKVAFSSIGTTTNVGVWNIYYVVNSSANTFQIASNIGGSAINLTGTDATMTLRYPSYIESINSNVSVTLSTPAANNQTLTSLTFRILNSAEALLKNWAISF